MSNYRLFESNNGAYNLAVLGADGNCVYYLSDLDHSFVLGTLEALKQGGDPIRDGWEGGEENPQECYAWIVEIVEERNGGAVEVDL